MSGPVRVQLRRAKGWRMPENTVKVDRSTPWGNPFVGGQHGTREECVRLHRLLLAGYLCLSGGPPAREQKKYRDRIARLAHRHLGGKNLACWCPLDGPCHADTLLEIVNAPWPGGT